MVIYELKTMQICEIHESTVVALGTFDGCHAGHISVFSSCRSLAMKMGVKSVAYTFSSLPKNKISGMEQRQIFTLDEKIRAIRESGIDYICVESFEDIMNLDGNSFLSSVLVEKLHAVGACCGFNFRFGKGAKCNASDLKLFFENIGGCVDICDKIPYENDAISSSLLRSFIEKGQVERLLSISRPYSIYAMVEHGKELGRTIGIPTINQRIPDGKVIPARGVYITECEIGEDVFPSITNVGIRPTVNDGFGENMETYIIGYSGNLYGSYVRVNFYKFIREEKRFDSLDDLKSEIEENAKEAINFFK